MGSSAHTQSSYADDLICLASTPQMAKALLHSAQDKLGAISLQLNSEKTECFSLPPVPSETLPGIDKSATGLTVLGRIIAGPDATDADLERKLSLGWQKFWRLKSMSWPLATQTANTARHCAPNCFVGSCHMAPHAKKDAKTSGISSCCFAPCYSLCCL